MISFWGIRLWSTILYVMNKSVYHRFSSRWFYYIAIIMVLQLFTIKRNTELYSGVDVDLLVFHSSLSVLRVCDVLDHCLIIHKNPKVTLLHNWASFVIPSSNSPLIHHNIPHTMLHLSYITHTHPRLHSAARRTNSLPTLLPVDKSPLKAGLSAYIPGLT
jgi:hypothetical protein